MKKSGIFKVACAFICGATALFSTNCIIAAAVYDSSLSAVLTIENISSNGLAGASLELPSGLNAEGSVNFVGSNPSNLIAGDYWDIVNHSFGELTERDMSIVSGFTQRIFVDLESTVGMATMNIRIDWEYTLSTSSTHAQDVSVAHSDIALFDPFPSSIGPVFNEGFSVASDNLISEFSRSGTFFHAVVAGENATKTNLFSVGTGGLAVTSPTVPPPPALYLFGSGLIGLVGMARRRTN